MLILVLSLMASAQALTTMWLLSGRHRIGFLSSLLNQCTWVPLAILAETYGLLILSAAMVVISIRGWRNWDAQHHHR
jgi:hypothetical protein